MKIDLVGNWDLEMNFDNGVEKYEITLPSTTGASELGRENSKKELHYLTEKFPFVGKAVYKKLINIPKEYDNKKFILFLERTKLTKVFIDDKLVSSSNDIAMPQRHILQLASGEHIIKIQVDNDFQNKEDIAEDLLRGHQLSEHTQTNWNGIIGEIYLEYIPFYINKVVTYGDTKEGKVHFTFISEDLKNEFSKLNVIGIINNKEYSINLKLDDENVKGVLDFPDFNLYDEFNPDFYEVNLKVSLDNETISIKEIFYFRDILKKEKSLYVNGDEISIRGNLDCAAFPRTGYSPTDRESWEKICKVHLDYGFNLIRFHSWCPPEIAFDVADEMGIYLQVELSIFGSGYFSETSPLYNKNLNVYIEEEAFKILDEYGNHPSFLIFSIGNEIRGDIKKFSKMVDRLKEHKSNVFHIMGTSNVLHPLESLNNDLYISNRTSDNDLIRASNGYAGRTNGFLEKRISLNTNIDFEKESAVMPLPTLAHETGQYQAFPNFNEIEKYTGPLEPRNFEIFKERLDKKGLYSRWEDYLYASTMVQFECYKEDIESNLRTSNLSGFQLLGLQDFPGQGTALVGILDSFYEEKGVIHRENWLQHCNNVVLLGRFDKYTFFSEEEFLISVDLYNYSGKDINDTLKVSLVYEDVDCQEKKIYSKKSSLSNVGEFSFILPKVSDSSKVRVLLECGNIKNEYSIWVYQNEYIKTEDTKLAFSLNEAKEYIEDGNVLLFLTDANKDLSISGAYTSDFWNYPMFETVSLNNGRRVSPGTLGGVVQNEHKALEEFATDKHTGLQWSRIINSSRPIILDDLIEGITPIVYMVDNFKRNHNLGFLFEVSYNGNRLMICTCNLTGEPYYPEFVQLYNSLVKYMNSNEYDCISVTDEEFNNLMTKLKPMDEILENVI